MEMADVYLNESTRRRSTRGSRTKTAVTSSTNSLPVHHCTPNSSRSTPACSFPPPTLPDITSPMMMR
uniref:Uncharacterized protein n=1 Tax=Arundo donax TaxID=35708 RepID=A0A0A8XQB8_ARUDO